MLTAHARDEGDVSRCGTTDERASGDRNVALMPDHPGDDRAPSAEILVHGELGEEVDGVLTAHARDDHPLGELGEEVDGTLTAQARDEGGVRRRGNDGGARVRRSQRSADAGSSRRAATGETASSDLRSNCPHPRRCGKRLPVAVAAIVRARARRTAPSRAKNQQLQPRSNHRFRASRASRRQRPSRRRRPQSRSRKSVRAKRLQGSRLDRRSQAAAPRNRKSSRRR